MLSELIQLADRLSLNGSSPFMKKKIHWFIDLNAEGKLISISPTVSHWKKTKDGETQENRGKEYLSPIAFYIKQNEKGEIIAAGGGGKAVAEPGIGNIPEIFCKEISVDKNKVYIQPLKESDKYKYANLVSLHRNFADAYQNNYLAKAIYNFLQESTSISLEELISKTFNWNKDEESYKKKMTEVATETFSFRVSGKLILNDSAFKKWWEKEFNDHRNEILSALPEGVDLLSVERNSHCKLTTVFPHISGVPKGGPYCPLASFDKEPFQSYGFDSTTTPMSLENAEKVGVSLNWLLHDNYSHLRIKGSDIVSVFWVIPNSCETKLVKPTFVSLLESDDPLEVKEYLSSPWTHSRDDIETSHFYLALISSPRSRITLRSWHTDTLRNTEGRLKSYFQTIIMALNGEDNTFSISELAGVTVRKGKNSSPLPNTYVSLFETALFGSPIPHKLFKAVLIRQGVEMAKGAEEKDFEKRLAARGAVIKLFFKTNKKGGDMTQEKHDVENNSGYLCGRLLAMLDKIHSVAHQKSGGTKNSPANRVYSVASKTPALIFPRLCDLARHHLNKMGGGLAYNLEFGIPKDKRKDGVDEDWEGLAEICRRFNETSNQCFPRILSLEDQGRFAIGFYYERERCKKMPETQSKENIDQNTDQNQKEG